MLFICGGRIITVKLNIIVRLPICLKREPPCETIQSPSKAYLQSQNPACLVWVVVNQDWLLDQSCQSQPSIEVLLLANGHCCRISLRRVTIMDDYIESLLGKHIPEAKACHPIRKGTIDYN